MIRRFRDLNGRRYAVPEDVLCRYEVLHDLPADEAVIGLEEGVVDGSREGDRGYRWTIAQGDAGTLDYTVASVPQRWDDGPSHRAVDIVICFRPDGPTVEVDENTRVVRRVR